MMKERTIDLLLMAAVFVGIGVLCMPAKATGQPQVDPAAPVANAAAQATSKASAGASSAIDLSLANSAMGGAAGNGGSVKAGDSYAFVSGSATPLPPGLCPKGDSSYVQVFWGLLTVASSRTRTEMECLDKVLGMLRDTAVKPVPLVNYVAPAPVPAPSAAPATVVVECKAPEPAKPASSPAVKAGKKKTAAVADSSCKA